MSEHKIEWTSGGKVIPTSLNLKVDDNIRVHYENISDYYPRYRFKITSTPPVSKEESEDILNQIVGMMISQSYDHGVHWVEINRECDPDRIIEGQDFFWYTWTVTFRVRDAG